MAEHNDKSKTEVFDAFAEEKPIVSRAENDAYSRARKSAYEENYYYEDEESKEKRGLTVLIIIISVLLCGAIIWGAYIFTTIDKDRRENLEKEINTETEVVDEPEEEKVEEEVVVKPDVVSYKVAFQKGTVEEEDGKYTVRVNLYDSSMNKTDSRRLVIDEKTEIREGKEKMSLNSFVYILKSSTSDAFVCDARVDEKNGVLVSISYSKKDVEKEEEKKEEENTEKEQPSEEEMSQTPSEEQNDTETKTETENETENEEVQQPAEPSEEETAE